MDIRYELATSGYTLTNKKTVVKLLKLSPSGYTPVRVKCNHIRRLLFAGDDYEMLNKLKMEHLQNPGKYW